MIILENKSKIAIQISAALLFICLSQALYAEVKPKAAQAINKKTATETTKSAATKVGQEKILQPTNTAAGQEPIKQDDITKNIKSELLTEKDTTKSIKMDEKKEQKMEPKKEIKKYGAPTGEQEKLLSQYLHPYAEEKPEFGKLAIELIKKINLDPNYKFPAARDASRSILIHLATFHGYLDLLKYLIEIGADINIENATKWRPLHIAAYLDSEKHKNKLEIVKFLVENGAILDNKIADLPTPISLIQPKTKIDFDVFYYLHDQMSKSKALMPGGAAGKI